MPDVQFASVTQSAIPIFIVAIMLEVFLIRFRGWRGAYETRDTFTSLLMGAGNVVSGIILGVFSYSALMWVWNFRLFDWGISITVGLIAFIMDDLRYYWYHRIAHTCRWVWAEHINHHSSQHYNLSTALRQSWTGLFTGMFVLQVPLVLLGFHPALLALVYGFNLVWQFFIHTELVDKLWKPVEWIMNTPSHHRVHHATNARYLDANYAGTLIIWDRIFGSFVPENEADAPRYGIIKNIATFNPVKVAFHEYVGIFNDVRGRGLNWRQRLNYLIKPPGWSHDGSRKTTAHLKADFVRLNTGEAGKPGLPKELPTN